MNAPQIATTVAETVRLLGKQVGITLQPFEDHVTGELWCVSVDFDQMGTGETLEQALANLFTDIKNKGTPQ